MIQIQANGKKLKSLRERQSDERKKKKSLSPVFHFSFVVELSSFACWLAYCDSIARLYIEDAHIFAIFFYYWQTQSQIVKFMDGRPYIRIALAIMTTPIWWMTMMMMILYDNVYFSNV